MPEGEIKLRPEIETLSMKLEADPKSKVFAQLADAYRKSNMVDEAIEIAKRGLEIHPNYAAAHLVLGRCYLEKRIYSLAREELERVASLDPHNSVSLKLLADVHFAQGAKEEAIRRYKQVQDIDPLNTEVSEKLGQLLPPQPAQEPEPKAPEAIVLGKLPPRSTLTGEQVSDMVDKMFVEKGLESPAATPPAESKASALEPEGQASAPVEAITPQEPVISSSEPVTRPTMEVLDKTPEPSPSEGIKESLFSKEDVSEVAEGLISEEGPKAPTLTLPQEVVSPPEPASELTPSVSAEVTPEALPSPPEAEKAPLTGEEVAGIVEEILAERNLGSPAIAPPKMPAMISLKPPEGAFLVKVEEAPVPSKSKGTGATATLAELYEQQGFYDKALELYEQVLAENPEIPALQAKVRELRSRTSFEESGEQPEVAEEASPVEAVKPPKEVPQEGLLKEEPPVVLPKAEEPETQPKAEEKPTPVVVPDEKPVSAQVESVPQPSTPLFHSETEPKPEGQERKGEIKSFQEWLDSLKKTKPET